MASLFAPMVVCTIPCLPKWYWMPGATRPNSRHQAPRTHAPRIVSVFVAGGPHKGPNRKAASISEQRMHTLPSPMKRLKRFKAGSLKRFLKRLKRFIEKKEKEKREREETLITFPETAGETFPETPPTEPPPPPTTTREGTLCKKLRGLGVRAAPHMVVVQEMCARHSDEHILAAAEIALEKKGSGIHVGYIAAMLKDAGKPTHQPAKG